jgi:hypothetical protein
MILDISIFFHLFYARGGGGLKSITVILSNGYFIFRGFWPIRLSSCTIPYQTLVHGCSLGKPLGPHGQCSFPRVALRVNKQPEYVMNR